MLHANTYVRTRPVVPLRISAHAHYSWCPPTTKKHIWNLLFFSWADQTREPLKNETIKLDPEKSSNLVSVLEWQNNLAHECRFQASSIEAGCTTIYKVSVYAGL